MRSVATRFGRLLLVLLLVTMFSAGLVSLQRGDAVTVIAPFASAEQRQQIRSDLHLDQPFPVRYAQWLSGFVRGDMGYTYSGPTSSSPVSEKVAEALPISLELMVLAQVLALLVAIPTAIVAAFRAGSWLDNLLSSSAFALLAFPSFVLAFLLAYYFRLKLGLFTVSFASFSEDWARNLQSLALPAITLAAGQIAVYMRLLRSDLVATLQQDFITMARSKGLSNRRILWRHALRPSSITLITAAGLNIGTLIGGSIVVEVIFGIPGMGYQVQKAMDARQLVAVQSLVAVIALVYVLLNVAIDVFYRLVDPRIRHD